MIVFQAPPDTGTRWMYTGIGSQSDSHHKPRTWRWGEGARKVLGSDSSRDGARGRKVGHLAPHQTRRPLRE